MAEVILLKNNTNSQRNLPRDVYAVDAAGAVVAAKDKFRANGGRQRFKTTTIILPESEETPLKTSQAPPEQAQIRPFGNKGQQNYSTPTCHDILDRQRKRLLMQQEAEHAKGDQVRQDQDEEAEASSSRFLSTRQRFLLGEALDDRVALANGLGSSVADPDHGIHRWAEDDEHLPSYYGLVEGLQPVSIPRPFLIPPRPTTTLQRTTSVGRLVSNFEKNPIKKASLEPERSAACSSLEDSSWPRIAEDNLLDEEPALLPGLNSIYGVSISRLDELSRKTVGYRMSKSDLDGDSVFPCRPAPPPIAAKPVLKHNVRSRMGLVLAPRTHLSLQPC